MTDQWQPSANIETLKNRARILQDIRAFFNERNVVEVQVPSITSASVTEVHIESIPVELLTGNAYLHTSPEYPMKRLLAAGMGDCFYMGSVFRQGESGGRHNPEFTMLEWYRINFSLEQLIDEVVALLTKLLDVRSTVEYYTYAEIVAQYAGVDVFNTSLAEIEFVLKAHDISLPDHMGDDLDVHLDLLISTLVFPALSRQGSKQKQVIVIKDYPESQAALAKIRHDSHGRNIAARFEVFVNGLEIANGYQEIQDAQQLEQRFKLDNQRRERLSKPQMPIDHYLLDAMKSGLPACSGVALGVDRLMMLALDKSDIRDVIAFPQDRC